ncbi:MAG TPA: MBL fold metallo-hydrolase [Chloroflexota bacterium]|nr:MBL fold metallo-hydrolase [Chloroflexota bacterium]
MATEHGTDPGTILERTPEGDSITFIGTATVLVRVGGFTVLTDPNFLHRGQHARLDYGLRSRRRTEPAMGIRDLPPLDLIVLSHFHEDHFDRIAVRGLDHTTPVVTTPHAAGELRKRGFRSVHAVERWQTHELRRGEMCLRVTAAPAQHGPRLVSRMLPPTMGSVWELYRGASVQGPRIYVTGDTLMHDDIREIPRRFPDVDLALLHLGGTRIFGILLTMDAGQGVEMIRAVRPKLSIPIHYDDYTVFKSSLRDFQEQVNAASLHQCVQYLQRGEAFQLRY